MSLIKLPIKTEEDVHQLFDVIQVIWYDVFTPIIGEKQVAYMLENYQSVKTIQDEIKQGAQYFLLTYDGLPSGYTAYEESEEQVYISKLYLMSHLRGKGLMSAIFNWYEELGIGKTLHLNVNQRNHLAISVYEHRGFIRVGERHVKLSKDYSMGDFVYEKQIKKS